MRGAAARVQQIAADNLLLIDDGNEEIGLGKASVPLKPGGATPMMVKGCLLSGDRAPHYVAIVVKRLCQYGRRARHRARCWRRVRRRREKSGPDTAEGATRRSSCRWSNPSVDDFRHPCLCRSPSQFIGCAARDFKAVVAVAEIEIVGIRLPAGPRCRTRSW